MLSEGSGNFRSRGKDRISGCFGIGGMRGAGLTVSCSVTQPGCSKGARQEGGRVVLRYHGCMVQGYHIDLTSTFYK